MNLTVTLIQPGTGISRFSPDGHYLDLRENEAQLIAKNCYQGHEAYDQMLPGFRVEGYSELEKTGDAKDPNTYIAVLFRRK